MEYVTSQPAGQGLELRLQGDWRAAHIAAIRGELARLPLAGITHIGIDAGEATVDLAGSWVLNAFVTDLAARGVTVQIKGQPPASLRLVQQALREREKRPATLEAHEHDEGWDNPVEIIGRTAVHRLQELAAGLAFLGKVTLTLLRAARSLRALRPISIARHIYDTGVTALPIVALIAFLISVIIAYLSASQLRDYGADIFVVDLVTVGVLRELGVLLTAIIIAGRSGSAFAAEIGAMKLNEEVDALLATGVDPIETLVLPRLIGLTIAMPLLTLVADLIGLAGGALLCHYLLDMPIQQFVNRANEAIASTTFWVGIIKAPVFAVLIALAGTYRGMQVRGSSRDLGRLTTVAVVQSIFLVLLADALFAILFLQLDI
jgi:phospholipid/cholesterol/gamma-HCH transport system permease protein